MDLTAAAVQFAPQRANAVRNLSIARQLAFEAVDRGAGLVVLPELCMTGPWMTSPQDAAQVAQTQDGWQTRAMSELAWLLKAYVVFGYVEVSNGAFYNSAMLVGPDGQVTNFRKRNLWGEDYFWATPGQGPQPVVVTPFGRLGVLICKDVDNTPRDFSDGPLYHRGSVDVICVPTSWNTVFEFPDSSWVDLARTVDCDVIVANRAPGPDEQFKGGSCVIDRNQRVWVDGCERDGECIVGGKLFIQRGAE